jgi:glycosyltransferase involved in cell wall biosynthesis
MAKKVLSVISTLANTGPVNVLKGVISRYDRERYEPVVATISPEPADSQWEEFQRLGIELRSMALTRADSLWRGKDGLRALVKSHGPDLIHCHGFRADVMVVGAKLGVPVMSTLHCDLSRVYALFYGKVAGSWMARREYAALRRCQAVVAVSPTVARIAAGRGVITTTILNGVNGDQFFPSRGAEEVCDLRTALGWPLDRKVFLHIGLLAPGKRPLGVIRAFLRSKQIETADLVFAGDGPLLEECRTLAAGHPNIHFLGQRRDIPNLLRAGDVLVSNSLSEGMPMALLEGCATGIQVLASDIEPHRDLRELFPDRVTLFDELKESALSIELDRMPQNVPDGPTLANASVEAISAQTMSGRYQKLYDQLLC